MAIIRCKECGRVCAASHGELCAACGRRTRQAEVKVAEYLTGHPKAALAEIRQATGVEQHIIMRMLDGEASQSYRTGITQRRRASYAWKSAAGQG